MASGATAEGSSPCPAPDQVPLLDRSDRRIQRLDHAQPVTQLADLGTKVGVLDDASIHRLNRVLVVFLGIASST